MRNLSAFKIIGAIGAERRAKGGALFHIMFSALKRYQFQSFILFPITAAGVVSCCGPKKSPCTSSIVQVIFSFEISGGILRNQKFIICLDSFSNQRLI